MFNFLDNISPLGQLMPKMFFSFADGDDGDGGDGGSGDAGSGDGDGGAGDGGAGDGAPAFSWKSELGEDLSKAPSLGKFQDTKEGLAELGKSYANLEKLLGHEKVPLPKGPEDVEGQAAFYKAIGVPGAPEEYNLPDAVLPDAIKDMSFDKESFQAIMHKHNLTPQQAEGLWKDYTQMSGDVYGKHLADFNALMDKNSNELRREWGDTYAAKVELGDMVINKFADDQEMADFLTASLAKDPKGMKFLAKIGEQFQENKIGDFKFKRFAMSAEEAQEEAQKMRLDPEGAYRNEAGKFTEKEHNDAVDYYNRLLGIAMGQKT